MRYCGRHFDAGELELIRTLLAASPPPSRYRLSVQVCQRLNWRRANGQLKDMSCRVALLRMQADGLITLPPPRNARPGAFRVHPDTERAIAPPPHAPRVELTRTSAQPVTHKRDSSLWNAYIERYHYLGHQLMPGAQLRYFVRAGEHTVALLGFGASAWKVKPRDEAIGWSSEARRRNLHLIVNNARFLILPWVQCRNLASHALALVSRRLPRDWQARYAYRPVLLETFVERARFAGTCYRAANWQCLGETQGRGKLDTLHRRSEPIKSIWIYPLVRDYRRHLCYS